jgi:hypothetical protein
MRNGIRIALGAALAISGFALGQGNTEPSAQTGASAGMTPQQEMFPAKPPELDKLRLFYGEWNANVTMTAQGGQPMQGRAHVTCNPTADRWATLCTMAVTFPGEKTMETTELFAYDAGQKQFHWVTASNMGNVAARDFNWTGQNDATARATRKNPQGSGTLTEIAAFHWKGADSIQFQSNTTLDGKPFQTFTGTFNRAARGQARTPATKR